VAQAAGAEVLGAAAIIDRGKDASRLNLPLYALAQLDVPAYEADVCPMCERGVPVTKPGSRAT
jgi:orotate phosphoribosyltransferase